MIRKSSSKCKPVSYSTKRRRTLATYASFLRDVEQSIAEEPVRQSAEVSNLESSVQASVLAPLSQALGQYCSPDDAAESPLRTNPAPSENPHAELSRNVGNNQDWYENDLLEPPPESDDEAEEDVDDLPPEEKFIIDLAIWATENNISGVALKSLLTLLRTLLPFLPADNRTVMLTKKVQNIKFIPGGLYYHFGLVNQLKNLLSIDRSFFQERNLHVQVNMDGLPLFKSVNGTFWPILGKLINPTFISVCEPFVIGLFYGKEKASKPLCLDSYLADFISEAEHLISDGLILDNIKYTVDFPSFIGDAPARAFFKVIKGHTGYSACEKCVTEGENMDRRMCFPELTAPLRTDCSFNQRTDEEHHLGVSPLTRIGVGLVSQVPLDYMHLVCLGVQKRLIKLWKAAPKKESRLGIRELDSISEHHSELRCHTPQEFARKPRALHEFPRWKATEFRMFNLYTGLVVLPDSVPEEHWHNFLLFSCGIRILASPVFCRSLNAVAKVLLESFVSHFMSLFGESMAVYNVHSLIHLSNDVMIHGPLDHFSSFPYENYLQRLKKCIRKPNQPLQQAVLRLGERAWAAPVKDERAKFVLKGEHFSGPLPYSQVSQVVLFKKAVFKSFCLSMKPRDSCFKIGNDVAVAKNFFRCSEGCFVLYSKFQMVSDYFSYPLKSGSLGIYLVSDLSDEVHTAKISCVECKLVMLPKGEDFVVLPLLHTQ